MIYQTKDRAMPVGYVPNDVADRETRAGAADRRWRSWSRPGCGSTHAGYSVDTRAAACSSCVARIRRGLPILDAKGLWEEALEHKDDVPLLLADVRAFAELKTALEESPESVHADAITDDVEWVVAADGRLLRASCEGPAGPKAGGVRISDLFVCLGCRGRIA
ncbi:MAG: hypothetical protein M3548_07345 [Actinomycetota bacterium]|nr:hypothetical protein [Actinomycetota bacterium]